MQKSISISTSISWFRYSTDVYVLFCFLLLRSRSKTTKDCRMSAFYYACLNCFAGPAIFVGFLFYTFSSGYAPAERPAKPAVFRGRFWLLAIPWYDADFSVLFYSAFAFVGRPIRTAECRMVFLFILLLLLFILGLRPAGRPVRTAECRVTRVIPRVFLLFFV